MLFPDQQSAPLLLLSSHSIANRRHVGAGNARNRAMNRKMSGSMPCDTATLASWNVT
jgi:hypothetical protein